MQHAGRHLGHAGLARSLDQAGVRFGQLVLGMLPIGNLALEDLDLVFERLLRALQGRGLRFDLREHAVERFREHAHFILIRARHPHGVIPVGRDAARGIGQTQDRIGNEALQAHGNDVGKSDRDHEHAGQDSRVELEQREIHGPIIGADVEHSDRFVIEDDGLGMEEGIAIEDVARLFRITGQGAQIFDLPELGDDLAILHNGGAADVAFRLQTAQDFGGRVPVVEGDGGDAAVGHDIAQGGEIADEVPAETHELKSEEGEAGHNQAGRGGDEHDEGDLALDGQVARELHQARRGCPSAASRS